MTDNQITEHIFYWLTKGNDFSRDKYAVISDKLGEIIGGMNKKERHRLYMSLKRIKSQ